MKPEWMSIAQKPKKKASTKKIIKTSLKEWNFDEYCNNCGAKVGPSRIGTGECRDCAAQYERDEKKEGLDL